MRIAARAVRRVLALKALLFVIFHHFKNPAVFSHQPGHWKSNVPKFKVFFVSGRQRRVCCNALRRSSMRVSNDLVWKEEARRSVWSDRWHLKQRKLWHSIVGGRGRCWQRGRGCIQRVRPRRQGLWRRADRRAPFGRVVSFALGHAAQAAEISRVMAFPLFLHQSGS